MVIFFEKPVQEWYEDDEYKKAKEVVDHMLVVNGCAERAIKLSSDFRDSSKKEETYQSNLHIIELNRNEKSNLTIIESFYLL